MTDYIKQLNGKELKGVFMSCYQLLFPEKVADNVNEAVDRIDRFFGLPATQHGSNIDGIQQIRKLLFGIADGYPHVNAFVITAPHTHWDVKSPVIYHFDTAESRYMIGPHAIDEEALYLPVSFVFSAQGIMPYEWTDQSTDIDLTEWEHCMDIIQQLNQTVAMFNFPLGISLDFRFKNSLFDNLQSTVEEPSREDDSFSYIYLEHEGRHHKEESFDQVGWHPVDDQSLRLNEEEMALLNDIRGFAADGGDVNSLLH